MPMYEYHCEEDGATIVLMRSMADADKPVEDPEGLGRAFRRIHSTFSVAQGGSRESTTGLGSCACPDGTCGL